MNNETPYGQIKPPKTITRIKQDRFLDLTNLHTWIMFLVIGICMALFRAVSLHNNIMDRLVYVSTMILAAFLWAMYFRTDELVEFQKDRLIFFIQGKRGNHTIDKMAISLNALHNILPIVGVHPSTVSDKNKNIPKGGIIEFASRTSLITKIKVFLKLEKKQYPSYGVLFETFPPRISDEFREIHEMSLEKIVNGLPVNTLFENISCSVMEPKKQVLDYILTLMHTSNGAACDQHLADIYLKIAEDEETVIKWRYFAYISLGEHKTLASARIQYGAVIPGLYSSMKNANLYPVILPDGQSVINAYQTMLGEIDL